MRFRILQATVVCFRLLLIHQFLQTSVNAQQTFATLPCAAQCPTCLNQFYYASAAFQRPGNGMTFPNLAAIDNPSVGFAEKIVCPNWCACSTTFCIKNINTNLYLYPWCNAAGTCAMVWYTTLGTGTALLTPSGTVVMPAPFVAGASTFGPANLATRVVTSASCNGCNYAVNWDTMVRVINETRPRRMDQLRRGDWVLAVSRDDGEPAFSRIDWWIHRSPTTMAEFRRLELENGVVLKLTAKHFIYRRCAGGRLRFLFGRSSRGQLAFS
ncbi:hint module domain-containing protein [Ditylenchus destructor]|nr:hint module domain-containing protein [Ditylenchus destructor]